MEQMSGDERRRRADAERNRRSLLDAAEELFRTRGLDVGVGEIAERAGVGRGTLFRNFPTKEDLIAAIRSSLQAKFLNRVPRPTPAASAISATLTASNPRARNSRVAAPGIWSRTCCFFCSRRPGVAMMTSYTR